MSNETTSPARREARAHLHTRLSQRWLRYKLLVAERLGRIDTMQDMHVAYWKGVDTGDYYERVGVRFDEWFLGPHQPFVSAVVACAQDNSFRQMVEVGCGDGQVLNAFSQRLPDIAQFTGMDVNPEIIARNSDIYSDNALLQFTVEDFTKTFSGHAKPDTLFLSYGGVLEYFTEADLRRILSGLAQTGCAFGLVEPVDPDHDLEHDHASHSFGSETSFSHDHRALLESCGWSVRYDEETRIAGIRFKMMVAEVAPLAS